MTQQSFFENHCWKKLINMQIPMQCWTMVNRSLVFQIRVAYRFPIRCAFFKTVRKLSIFLTYFWTILQSFCTKWANIIPLDIVTLFNFPSEIYGKSHFCYKWSLCTTEVVFFLGGGGKGVFGNPWSGPIPCVLSYVVAYWASLLRVVFTPSRLKFRYWGSTIDSK